MPRAPLSDDGAIIMAVVLIGATCFALYVVAYILFATAVAVWSEWLAPLWGWLTHLI